MMRNLLATPMLAALLAAPMTAHAEPAFRPVQMPAQQYVGGWEHFVGGGVAVFDCDGDNLPELFAAGGSDPAMLMRNRSDGDIRFEADTPAALAVTGVTGAYPVDIDNDGILDLAVLRAGPNLLFKGGADCSFAPFDIGFGSTERWTTAFSATWEPGQTLPTLAFGNYVDRDNPDGPFKACDAHRLYRPAAGRYDAPLLLTPGYCALSMLFTDWDRTGRADLRVSNDRHYHADLGEEQMWNMAATPPVPFTAAQGWRRHVLWGMGIASRDLDGDGTPEVMLSSMGDQRLQSRDGAGPVYKDEPFEAGATAHTPYTGPDQGKPSTGWHVEFGDVQNDGLDDLFIAKGNVDSMEMAAMADPNNMLLRTANGHFVEAGVETGLASMHRGRGAALADFNGDGLLDVVVVNRRAPLELWQNVTSDAGHWLTVDLRQAGANTRAIGAFVEVRAGDLHHTREVTIGGGHAGGQSGPQHFGLGDATSARVRVTWPDGTATDWQEVAVDTPLVLRR